MKNRTTINLVLAFIILPIFLVIRDYYRLEILHDYSMYAGTFEQYYKMQRVLTIFLAAPTVFSILILLPYNFALIYIGERRQLNLLHKIFLLNFAFITIICIAGTFMNIWLFPAWKNLKYLYYFLPVSTLFAILIHFLVDRKEKMKKN